MENMEFICTKCHQKVKIDAELFNAGIEQNVECCCGAKMLIKKPTDKMKSAKKVANKIGKEIEKFFKFGRDFLVNEATKYQEASNRLFEKGMDEWDENRLKEELNNSFRTSYEKAAIRLELKNRYKNDWEYTIC